ncbi:PfaD family polyunsaturated fatty acid/polyketide biosynthesis protein [Antrihabitans cavernicola]|uniref:PfaD family polyunsaturated fatty acid/polyketide biosynthesis protein n=1 Tax=Antrihabitans cavernicola TaxID=2495913 RepID=A0A5A7SEZ7_9NOCA|nr:PfaD family polyunsaturated fatty acid/polyketide biosynthesis protein [Spelaeibacter cavernicola]KAA0024154.1 PfaD family polyunsaturated fatty acid/polyketide biosynthesis protein [Spelaeibacter cavernicola]
MTAPARWSGNTVPRFDADGIRAELENLDQHCYLVSDGARTGAVAGGQVASEGPYEVLAQASPSAPESLGSNAFRRAHGVRMAYMAGSMANGIASVDLVVALARSGGLSSFGAAGLSIDRISAALDRFSSEIPGLPFACNLIHSPAEPKMERETVDLYLRRGVRCVEASAFLDLTPEIVRYSVSGLRRDRSGGILNEHRVIAKISRSEVAEKFMRPAPWAVLDALVADGLIEPEQAALAADMPVAGDITVEADSGGHTDRRPLAVALPALLRLRNSLAATLRPMAGLRIGAAGGLGTPEALAAAFAMGADYVVTGSVNQSCVEAGTSARVKQLLSRAGVADCAMAPAADMFEIGAEVQVLKSGTMYPMRAARLREFYRTYDGLEAVSEKDVRWLESVFGLSVDAVWAECLAFFNRRDPEQILRAKHDPKRRMALVFRWYLGMSAQWASSGEVGRVRDYQVWCGPAMGGFNDWATGSHLEDPANRFAAEIGRQLMTGAAYHLRMTQLRAAGAALSARIATFEPTPRTANHHSERD